MANLEGVDFSWARPGGAALAAAGKKFAVRYLYADGQGGKGLDTGELSDYAAHGVDVAVVYESTANRALAGHDAGVADAQAAQAQLRAVGLPAGMPIYFAVDFDVTDAQKPSVAEYLTGVASVIGSERVGVYGGYWCIKYMAEHNVAKWFWQTYAWSGGQWHPANHIEQYLNGQNINGAVDLCRSKQDNFGQASKFSGSTPLPAPAPQQAQPSVAAAQTYTIKAGDTLSAIASRFGTTAAALAALNDISNPNLIYPGHVLRLTAANPKPSTPAPGGQTYTVVKGDTLSGIAQRFGTSWQALAQLNGIADANKIYPGQVLKVGGGSAAPAPAQRTYTVKSGDTLSGIASAHGTSWQKLQSLNGIADANKIYPGQVIRLS